MSRPTRTSSHSPVSGRPRRTRVRSALAATALAAVLATGPAAPAFAHAPAAHDSAGTADTAPRCTSAGALCTAIAGLPGDDATAALVRVGGKEGTWRGSAGVHDLTSGRAADPAARFRAGSVTKVFTAAVVLQLASEHRVSLGRPVRHYLPDLIPGAYRGVTVRQLLNHTSGLPSSDSAGDSEQEWYEHRFDRYTPHQLVASAVAKKPLFAPGTRQKYDNIGYTVAGLLIERVTHDSYAHQVTRRILDPLGLRDSYFPGTATGIRGPHNHGYQVYRGPGGTSELRDVTEWGQTESWAAGDLITSTADLEHFTRALFSGHVVRGPQLSEMFTLPHLRTGTPEYSAGLSVITLGGRQVWAKTGGRWGYNAVMAATRDLSRTLVYSVNSTDAKGEDMNPTAMKIAVAAFGAPPAG
ncbi:serine hydrolase domain-containing protein [Streptomyces sp. NBC_00859]|uniref:serine hydrolase domain-containing protein n=1 Tax=Streptomyces sp. NBC_00859 TaxID=2903682 RepID=UPI00386AC2DE|nr:beta-lactamase family protein [Streptomyces sp. NBC_00859]